MRWIRLLPLDKYERKKRRFQRNAFDPYEGGVSIIDPACVAGKGREICSYARELYRSVIKSEPFAFWIFDDADLPDTKNIVPDDEDNHDDCHFDIRQVDREEARSFLRNAQDKKLGEWFVCEEGQSAKALGLDEIFDILPD